MKELIANLIQPQLNFHSNVEFSLNSKTDDFIRDAVGALARPDIRGIQTQPNAVSQNQRRPRNPS
jgi:hypothetical protein